MEKRFSLCQTIYVIILYTNYVSRTSAMLDCNFDQDFCDWTQEKKHDNFDWKRTSGGTSTEGTGPDFDHTSGVGFYTYIDSSDAQKGSKARLVSPVISKGIHCLSFWYYMYGKDVGTLRIFRSNKWTRLLQIPGNVGKGWKFRQLQISPVKNFKIIIEGQVKNSNQHDLGDIAIDDIVMLSGPCPTGCGDPTPEFGSVNTSNVKITSVVGITCKAGYRIEGSSTIVCLANGTWSDTPRCNLIDCGTRNITNGQFSAIFGTTVGKTATQSCNMGYILTGRRSVTCTESGWNGAEAKCRAVDCLSPHIVNGRFVKPLDGTTYNSSAKVTCKDGYTLLGNDTITCQADGNWSSLPHCAIKNCSDPTPFNGEANDTLFQYKSEVEIKCQPGFNLIGNSSVVCQANGNWSSNPFCEEIDCLSPTISHGVMAEMEGGTTYNQTVLLACTDGYTLTGSRFITCQDDGNWTALPTCLSKDSESASLTAVYVAVPSAAVVAVLVIVLLAITRREVFVKCLSPQYDGNYNGKSKSQQSYHNEAYASHNSLDEPGPELQSAPARRNSTEHEEYPIYNNTVGTEQINSDFNYDLSTVQANDDYDHTDSSATAFAKTTYSSVMRNKGGEGNDSTYNTTGFVQDMHDENNTYDHLDGRGTGTIVGPQMQIGQDPDYDHAKVGGSDMADLVEYSHLNVTTIKQLKNIDDCEYMNTKDMPNGIEGSSQTMVFEGEDRDTTEDDREYFVLEKEDTRDDQATSNSHGNSDHDYYAFEP